MQKKIKIEEGNNVPTYTVKCINESCSDHAVEKEIKKRMSEDYPPCEMCGGATQTVFQAVPSAVFKGGGWCKKRTRR